MKELYRVFINKQTALFLAILVLLNVTFYLYQCNDHIDITLQGEELEQYLSFYPEFLDQIDENVSNMKLLSIYQKDSSFVNRNLDQTAKDYDKLHGITLQAGENRGIATFLSFHLTDLLLLAFCIYLVLRLIEDRGKGLHYMIRSTSGGRLHLCCQRILILFVSITAVCLLLYGGSFLVSLLRYGDASLQRPLQSVPEFMYHPLPITIGEYLLLNLLLKLLAGISFSLLLYACFGLFKHLLAWCIFLSFSLLEYFAYQVFLSTGKFNVLKYVNLYTLLRTEDFFTKYLNLNLFGQIISIQKALLIASLLLVPILIALSLFGHAKRYVNITTSRNSLIDRIQRKLSQHEKQLPLLLWEGRKIFFQQGGILFFLLIFILAFSSARSQNYIYPKNDYDIRCYEKYNAPITQDMTKDIQAEYDDLVDVIGRCQRNYDKLEKESKKYLPDRTSDTRYIQMLGDMDGFANRITKYQQRLDSVSIIKETAETGLEYSKRTGNQLWVIKPYSYQLLLVDDIKTVQKNSTYILIAMIGIFSGIMAYEKTTHMNQSLRTLKRGRGKLLSKKLLWIFLTSFVVSITIHLIQLLQIKDLLGLNDLSVPVQSIISMRDFPFSISIQSFLILLFLLRVLATFLIGIVVMVISHFCQNSISTIAVSIFLLVLPSVLDAMNILPFGFISPTDLLGIIQ